MRNDIKYMAGKDLDICGDRIGVARGWGEPCDAYRMRLIETLDRREGGGSAFGDSRQAGDCSVKAGGVTIRDYFAAKAMAACLSSSEAQHALVGKTPDEGMAIISKAAYMQADAMLRERAK